jgi:hypothetical protein
MKKFFGILIAALLVIGLACQANAAYTYTNGDLIRVVYDVTSTTGAGAVYNWEAATDLGSAANIISNPTGFTDSSNFNLFNSIGSSGNFSSNNSALYVAYFAVNNSQFWTSGTQGASETNTGSNVYTNTVESNAKLIVGLSGYGSTSSNAQSSGNNIWLATSLDTYFKEMNHNNVTETGGYSNFFGSSGNGDASITAGGSTVLQDLFYWNPGSTKQTITGSVTLETTINSSGVITTVAEQEVSATPIPPSMLLFGTGLLGLVGIGRKNIFKS